MISKLLYLLSAQPSYRLNQIHKAWFDLNINNYDEITTLPKNLREQLKNLPWLTVKEKIMQTSKIDNTKKVLLELADGNTIETVLMRRKNKKLFSQTSSPNKILSPKRYTICISTQVGCVMGCAFCATGQMGFTRNLTTEEIVDQYRFWQRYLNTKVQKNRNTLIHTTNEVIQQYKQSNISNIVLMGQGEPLLNYDNVKEAINIILNNTEIGPSKITLSTVGIIPAMKKMLTDQDFPPIRFALSLHSAIEKTRANIIPSHQTGFLDWLVDWSKKYHQINPSRSHFIGLEYILLKDINDSKENLKALKKLASKLGHIRINLIPYNSSGQSKLKSTQQSVTERWRDELMKSGFIVTIRHSHGQDITAACGQLANSKKLIMNNK